MRHHLVLCGGEQLMAGGWRRDGNSASSLELS